MFKNILTDIPPSLLLIFLQINTITATKHSKFPRRLGEEFPGVGSAEVIEFHLKNDAAWVARRPHDGASHSVVLKSWLTCNGTCRTRSDSPPRDDAPQPLVITEAPHVASAADSESEPSGTMALVRKSDTNQFANAMYGS